MNRIEHVGEPKDKHICPVCGTRYNAELGPYSTFRQPDSGEWCFKNGVFYIHEELVFTNE